MKPRTLIITGIAVIIAVGLTWFALTDNPAVWPIRHPAQYYLFKQWWSITSEPTYGPPVSGSGTIRDEQGQPLVGARILFAQWDGHTFTSRTDTEGLYTVDVPAGAYRPVVGAPGYDKRVLGTPFRWLTVAEGTTISVDLSPTPPRNLPYISHFSVSQPQGTFRCDDPLPSSAVRQQVFLSFEADTAGLVFYYKPYPWPEEPLPLLLVIYPGPVESWECASIPLADSGYGVIAVGLDYSFDVEKQIDTLEQLLNMAQEGNFPQSDGQEIAVLGGSFSSLHVMRLLERRQDVSAGLLLGPPSDLFDIRRRLEREGLKPPFGLDQFIIAGGFPDRNVLSYWTYSPAYHVQADLPPLAILHSRTDEIVPFQQTEILAEALNEVGAEYEPYFFDGASHYLLAPGGDEDTQRVYDITLDFLGRRLGKQ